ncbi:hypothetical protein GMI69_06830 [Eggerthellaceae bacterium zg-887]|uniref:hypothetical protein n=1 Tax=Xiamenia xianingshaonis TaxID=2682776 RepID=UPI0014098C6E|nr:hypothetical protein [Xiamenia xianingshaonis]NHM16373.1 hypothetical protein [Xiamenia xianingshaonis]
MNYEPSHERGPRQLSDPWQDDASLASPTPRHFPTAAPGTCCEPPRTPTDHPAYYGFGYLPLKHRIIAAAVLLAIALVSFFPLGALFSSPETYSGTIATLDEKRGNVTALMATSTAASAAISLLPGDAGTPIADKLADLSVDFLIVLSAIYLEKFLLTTIGMATFRILIPLGIALIIAALFIRSRMDVPGTFVRLATKLIVFGLALTCVIPASVAVTNSIDATFNQNLAASVAETQAAVDQLNEATEDAAAEGEKQDQNFFEDMLSAAEEGINSLTHGVEDALASLNSTLGNVIDTLAVMVVTSCIIPIVVLLFFLWIVNTLTGLNINLPMRFTRYIPTGGGR